MWGGQKFRLTELRKQAAGILRTKKYNNTMGRRLSRKKPKAANRKYDNTFD
jgi:hypothetical protein